jgi:AraC-like DNA-binding protein
MLLETNSNQKSFSLLESDYMPPDLQLLKRLQVLIERDFRGNRDIRTYPPKLNSTLYHLNMLARAYLGKSVYELLQDRIHQEALYLLRFTTLPIKQISIELGCSDAPYFCRCFKQITGMNPLAYRKLRGKEPILSMMESLRRA